MEETMEKGKKLIEQSGSESEVEPKAEPLNAGLCQTAPLTCKIGLHKWSKWVQYDRNKDGSYRDYRQKRKCLKCDIEVEKCI
jgi:hypothetical protein